MNEPVLSETPEAGELKQKLAELRAIETQLGKITGGRFDRLGPDWRERAMARCGRRWGVLREVYEDLLGEPMPSLADLAAGDY